MTTLRVIGVALLLATKGRRYGPGPQLKMIRDRWPDITHAEVRAAVRLSRTYILGLLKTTRRQSK
jgi:hypothetical protein